MVYVDRDWPMMNLNPYVLSNPVSLVSCLETLVWIPFGINDKINFWSNGDTSYSLDCEFEFKLRFDWVVINNLEVLRFNVEEVCAIWYIQY